MLQNRKGRTVDVDVEFTPGAKKAGLYFYDSDLRAFFVDRVTPEDLRELSSRLILVAAMMEIQGSTGQAR